MGPAGGNHLWRKPFGGAGPGDRLVGGGFVGSQPLEDGVQGVQLAQPLSNPYVVIGQLPTGALPVLVAAQLDQGGGPGALIAQLYAGRELPSCR